MAILVLAASQLLFSLLTDAKYESTEMLALVPDMALAIYLMVIALTTDRFWPLWAAAFQSVAVLTHLAVLAMPHMMPTAYAVAQGLWLYGVLIALVLGIRSVKTGVTNPVDGRVSPS
ncbi:hypothetical protein KCG44_06215 [Pacificimonas sp. WHA3]|uniref:Uncharacterized protein n=1 Tax=Pacificimonas pallii TaxID=2827236 RepID=A0ABS6SD86_9SPHN|nr:hypothetical protein [Pacificimonas pallii]MBV7256379.1 hypothetical protein [Pacificimonas pallii]